MGNALSQNLLELGFVPVLGTTEREGLPRGGDIVKPGMNFTWDTNNGVMVIHDERGWPWIRRSTTRAGLPYQLTRWFRELSAHFKFVPGCYVPHSNDGGNFIRSLEEMGINLQQDDLERIFYRLPPSRNPENSPQGF